MSASSFGKIVSMRRTKSLKVACPEADIPAPDKLNAKNNNAKPKLSPLLAGEKGAVFGTS